MKLKYQMLLNFVLDGIVTKREMLAYQDPKHPYRASKEAQKIIDTADTDGDGMLQVEEFIKVSIQYKLNTAIQFPFVTTYNYEERESSIFE